MDLYSHTLAEETAKLKKELKLGIKNDDNNEHENSSGRCEMDSNSGDGDDGGDENSDESSSDELENQYYRQYLNNILKYMITMVEIMEKIHEKGVIHRDIKPENFMISQTQTQNCEPIKKLHIIDFGLSRVYIKDGAHIPNKPNSSIVGTMRYISTHIHEGNVYSRRDDIISILYVIIYLLKGRLPWCGLKTEPGDKRTKTEIVYEVKKRTTIKHLCKGLPAIFERMLTYAYKMEFDEKPDYIYLKRLCKQELSRDD